MGSMCWAGLFVPLFLGGEPNAVTESVWGLAWVGLGVVLIRVGSPAEG